MPADYPYGPREPGRIEKTLDVAARILDDPFPDPDDDERGPEPREIGRQWVEQWRAFAGEQGFTYRGGVAAPGFTPDASEEAFLREMRALHLPLAETRGLTGGTWQGVPFTSFDAVNFGAAGSHWPYRFVCARVREHGPELVHDRALRRRRPYHVDWYPRLPEYRVYNGPWNEPDTAVKLPAALRRSAFGRGLSKAVENAADRLTRPTLHTTSLDLAAAVGARPYEHRPFAHDWAVRGRWLTVFQAAPDRIGGDAAGGFTSLLDGFIAVRRLWEAVHDGE